MSGYAEPRRRNRHSIVDCPLQGQGCPTADELAAVANGTLADDRRDALAAILAYCTHCVAAVQRAADPSAEWPAETEDESAVDDALDIAPVAAIAQRWRPPSWLVVGATVVLLLVAMLPGIAMQRDRLQTGEVTSSVVQWPVQPTPGARLAAAPSVLTWDAPVALACRVVIRRTQADVIVRTTTISSGRLDLKPELRAQLASGSFEWLAECGDRELGPYAFSVHP